MIKKLRLSLIGSALLVSILAQKHSGFLLIFVLAVLIPWAFYSLVIMFKKAEMRKIQTIKLLLWITSIIIIGGLHLYYHMAARDDGNYLVTEIMEYKHHNGRYPSDLNALKLSPQKYSDEFDFYYFLTDQGPALFYKATYIVFNTYQYNFKTNIWEFKGS